MQPGYDITSDGFKCGDIHWSADMKTVHIKIVRITHAKVFSVTLNKQEGFFKDLAGNQLPFKKIFYVINE